MKKTLIILSLLIGFNLYAQNVIRDTVVALYAIKLNDSIIEYVTAGDTSATAEWVRAHFTQIGGSITYSDTSNFAHDVDSARVDFVVLDDIRIIDDAYVGGDLDNFGAFYTAGGITSGGEIDVTGEIKIGGEITD